MIRPTAEGQERRRKQLEELRARMARVSRLAAYRQTQDWKDLRDIIQGFIDSEENAVKQGVLACAAGGYYDVSEQGVKRETDSRLVSDVRVAYERKNAFQLVVDLVEKTDEQVQHLQDAIARVEDTFKKAKQYA